jgi:hypothetical protein
MGYCDTLMGEEAFADSASRYRLDCKYVDHQSSMALCHGLLICAVNPTEAESNLGLDKPLPFKPSRREGRNGLVVALRSICHGSVDIDWHNVKTHLTK